MGSDERVRERQHKKERKRELCYLSVYGAVVGIRLSAAYIRAVTL